MSRSRISLIGNKMALRFRAFWCQAPVISLTSYSQLFWGRLWLLVVRGRQWIICPALKNEELCYFGLFFKYQASAFLKSDIRYFQRNGERLILKVLLISKVKKIFPFSSFPPTGFENSIKVNVLLSGV